MREQQHQMKHRMSQKCFRVLLSRKREPRLVRSEKSKSQNSRRRKERKCKIKCVETACLMSSPFGVSSHCPRQTGSKGRFNKRIFSLLLDWHHRTTTLSLRPGTSKAIKSKECVWFTGTNSLSVLFVLLRG